MAFELTGRIIEKYPIQEVSEKFRKREFVVEYRENPNFSFSEMIKFQLTQDKVSLIDAFAPGQDVKVSFNLRGRKWEKDGNVNYFTNLEAWRIEPASAQPQQSQYVPGELPGATALPAEDPENDLPF